MLEYLQRCFLSPRTSHVIASVMLLVIGTAGCSTLQGERYVARIIINNKNAYVALVEVRGRLEGGWLDLGTAGPHAEIHIDEVLDMGSEWIFRFRRAGGPPEDRTLSRAELESFGWTVQVPSDLSAATP